MSDPSVLDLQTAMSASEKILVFVQKTCTGRPPPITFFVQAWAQTRHAFSEQLRVSWILKLKDIVQNGTLCQTFWASFVRGGSVISSCMLAIGGDDPNIYDELKRAPPGLAGSIRS